MSEFFEKFDFKEGQERLNKLEVNPKSISWRNDIVINPQSILNFDYWEEEISIKNEKVDLNKIKGTFHRNYYGKTWIEMLGHLDRASDTSKETALNWIKRSTDISLNKYGDEYFISGGNHRICIAKFLGIKQLQVNSVIHHCFNHVRFEIDKEMKERGISKIYSNETILILDLGEAKIHLNYTSGSEFIDIFDKIKISKWKRFNSKNLLITEDAPIGHHHLDSMDTSELKKIIESFKLNGLTEFAN